MPRPAVVLVLLWDRTTARDTACARPGYSGRCWASRAWSSRTSRSRSIRTVTRRSWWCLRVPTPGRRVGALSAVGGARAMTRGWGYGGGGRWTPAPFGRSCSRRRIGIDEIAYRKGHRYLTCVVDHNTGRLVWAHEGRNKDTLTLFFDALGPTRSALLTRVSADGAEWIHAVVREKAPKAAICLDPFHVVMWATKALDKVRRRTLEHAGDRDRNARWAVVKNPDDLTADQRQSLATIRTTNTALYRAYLLKEQLRAVFVTKGRRGEQLLAGWIAWARRSRLHEFVALARTIKRFQQLIWNTLHKHGVSNARSEATNTHIRALTKRAYGYHSPEALIAMAMLTRGGLELELPGRK